MKLRKGSVYLVRRGVNWYIVRQAGQRSWEALHFSHIDGYTVTPSHFHGNAETLLGFMVIDGQELEYHRFYENSALRRAMFNILKTGKGRR